VICGLFTQKEEKKINLCRRCNLVMCFRLNKKKLNKIFRLTTQTAGLAITLCSSTPHPTFKNK